MKKKLFLLVSLSLIICSCTENQNENNINEDTIEIPSVTTLEITNIRPKKVSGGGYITSNGGGNITARGLCWNTSPHPTVDLTTVFDTGISADGFTSDIYDLTPNTTYYVRAYFTNSAGTGYGNEISFTTTPINLAGPNLVDIDGNVYETVSNCNQTWTKKNLNVSKYSDGTPIPQVTSMTEWSNLTTGAWCYYNNDPSNANVYGKLYNWYAVAGIYDSASLQDSSLRKKLAPQGWHVPADSEWTALGNCFEGLGFGDAGGKMKSIGTTLWQTPNNGATNESGFTGLPGGSRSINGVWNSNFGQKGIWWSISEAQGWMAAWSYSMSYDSESLIRFADRTRFGFSVRCVKD